MTELPISSKYRSRPQDPVPEAERNDLSARLNEAFTDGSLDQDAYADRLDRLFAAQTLGELVPVVQGLPPRQTYRPPAIVEQSANRPPGEVEASRAAVRPAILVTAAVVGLGLLIVVLLLILII